MPHAELNHKRKMTTTCVPNVWVSVKLGKPCQIPALTAVSCCFQSDRTDCLSWLVLFSTMTSHHLVPPSGPQISSKLCQEHTLSKPADNIHWDVPGLSVYIGLPICREGRKNLAPAPALPAGCKSDCPSVAQTNGDDVSCFINSSLGPTALTPSSNVVQCPAHRPQQHMYVKVRVTHTCLLHLHPWRDMGFLLKARYI